jgi:ATP-dependent DNA helicase RecG
MPSALEKLVKILRLEQETGYKDTAVIGGLQSFASNWSREAHQQARTDEHHALVEELANAIDYYSGLNDKESRYNTVRYMLGRITGRTEPLPEFVYDWTEGDQQRLEEKMPPEPSRGEREMERHEPERSTDDAGDIFAEAFEVVETIETPSPAPIQHLLDKTFPKPRRQKREDLDLQEKLERWRALDEPIDKLKGVGKRRSEQLARLGIQTVGDLLLSFPRRYDDYTQVRPLNKIVPMENVSAVGTIKDFSEKITRDNRRYLRVMLEDMTGRLPVIFFGQPHLKRYFRPGMQIAVYGKVELYLGKPQLTNPEWEEVANDGVYEGSIIPVYSLTKGLSNKVMRNLVEQAVTDYLPGLPDYVPLSVLERTEMVDLDWALQQIHFPENQDYLQYAQERLAFDELMLLQLGILAKREEWQAVPGIPMHVNDHWLEGFKSNLPYELTSAQQRAVAAIRKDIASDTPMNRLLQGDVGAGKTVVAAIAMAMAITNGKQAAIMAPTSILAEQHYQGIGELLDSCLPEDQHFEIRLLTGGTSDTERREIYEGMANGTIDVVVGTHALIQERVEFDNLALAVIDEQHRFGVDERGSLRGKGTNPHVLVMTATPIPRTLALTMYADLDLTVLDELPPGRIPIETRVIHPSEREQAYSFIRHHLDKGQQAYIIYPLVEASHSIQARAAVESYEELSKSDFYEYRMGLLHGRVSPKEKDEIMSAFAIHELDVLVSTTVIEVGINVPNATIIMIEGANRFGLAQLHQLRGRVGRGQLQSYCLLLADNPSPDAMDRLRALEGTTDGFELAELDWQMRGAGDLLGTRQAGASTVSLDSMMNVQLVELAQMESRALFEEDPALDMPEHALLSRQVEWMRHRKTDFS